MHRVAILAYDGMSLFELGCATEIFALHRPEFRHWYDTDVVTFEQGTLSTTGNIGLSVKSVTSLNEYDTLVIPSWHAQSNKVRLDLATAVVDFAQRGKRLITFCSGTFLLAQLGLLKGKKVTTHWRYAQQLTQQFPDVTYVDNVLYTQEDNIACSAGSAAALDLALEIVRQDFGHDTANQIARRLVMSPHRSGGQAQYVETPVVEHHQNFARTLDWAIRNLDKDLVVDDMADHAAMSRRSFDRHFRASMGMSPKAWLNQQRVLLAKQTLEKQKMNLDQLARQVGFDNAITLRFNFNKYVGISPSQYQNQFSMRA